MEPVYVFSETEREQLQALLESVSVNPYEDYPAFSLATTLLLKSQDVPDGLRTACGQISAERTGGRRSAHVLGNCPFDKVIPPIDHDNPLEGKYRHKRTYVGEAFLEVFAQLTGTPLLAYATRSNGDFFTDVVAHNRFRGMQTGFSDSELVFHNDRTAHLVRADFITLLGMRCPDMPIILTGFVDGRDLLRPLSEAERYSLREPFYCTPFDVVSRANNHVLALSEHHSILSRDHSFRYLDGYTAVAPGSPTAASDALAALKRSLGKAPVTQHQIRARDLFTFANQEGLHNRKKRDVTGKSGSSERWLLKTYAFRDAAALARSADRWAGRVAGRVSD